LHSPYSVTSDTALSVYSSSALHLAALLLLSPIAEHCHTRNVAVD